jgi:hypothetical protein
VSNNLLARISVPHSHPPAILIELVQYGQALKHDDCPKFCFDSSKLSVCPQEKLVSTSKAQLAKGCQLWYGIQEPTEGGEPCLVFISEVSEGSPEARRS